jgi:hypothetical protein
MKSCVPLLSLLLLLSLASCDPYGGNGYGDQPPETTQGYSPIYDSLGTAKVIKADTARDIGTGGKIYVKGKTLYQVEVGKGIHVTNIADASNPVKVKFLQVLGCQELSIKDNFLYTNNLNDLVVVDITDINNPQVKDRLTNTFKMAEASLPPNTGWFECPDASKGTIIGWQLKTLHYPQCR